MTKWISIASVLRIIDADPVYSDVINEKTYMASQINNLPTKEETSRPRGEWIEHTIKTGWSNSNTMFECSTCRSSRWHSFKWSFCPVCGSDNRKRGEAE